MARVTILNDRYYSVTVDANGDGVLDMPLVVSLVEQHLTFNGPFPRTFMFNSLGRVVDSDEKAVPPTPITIANSSGASMVKLSDAGYPSIERP